ncbi:MAG TPA: pilus assembly protein TadG-related protein [Nocardioidaceae bacterium]
MTPAEADRGSRVARARDEHGQTAVLIVGLAVVVAMTVVVVVDATAAYLRRQALSTLADGAALAAADGIQGEQVYVSGLGERPTVDPQVAQQLVADYLGAVGAPGRYPGLSHVVETRDDRVVVRLASPLDLPFGVPGVGDSAHVTATAAAVIALTDGTENQN